MVISEPSGIERYKLSNIETIAGKLYLNLVELKVVFSNSSIF